jgi:type II secretory pathway component HofQ
METQENQDQEKALPPELPPELSPEELEVQERAETEAKAQKQEKPPSPPPPPVPQPQEPQELPFEVNEENARLLYDTVRYYAYTPHRGNYKANDVLKRLGAFSS